MVSEKIMHAAWTEISNQLKADVEVTDKNILQNYPSVYVLSSGKYAILPKSTFEKKQ
jgi:hypothetical protein